MCSYRVDMWLNIPIIALAGHSQLNYCLKSSKQESLDDVKLSIRNPWIIHHWPLRQPVDSSPLIGLLYYVYRKSRQFDSKAATQFWFYPFGFAYRFTERLLTFFRRWGRHLDGGSAAHLKVRIYLPEQLNQLEPFDRVWSRFRCHGLP